MTSRTFSLERTSDDSISYTDDTQRFSLQSLLPSLRSDEEVEEALKEQEEKIDFWSKAKIRRPAIVLKSGWYALISDIAASETVNREVLRYVCRGKLRRGTSLGFPCSYLDLPLHVIDIKVRFPSSLYERRKDTSSSGIDNLRYVADVLRLMQVLHENGITGMSFEEGYVHCATVQYDNRKSSQRRDMHLFAKQMSMTYLDAPLQQCYEDASRGKSANYILDTHFSEFPRRSFLVPKVKRHVLPSSNLLENILVEAKKYPDDTCRFYFLAFDWAYRVSETLDYPLLARDLVQMTRSLLRYAPDAEERVEERSEDSERRQRNIVLVLNGILLVEPIYRKCIENDVLDNSMLFAAYHKILRKSIAEPETYLTFLSFKGSIVSASRRVVTDLHMKDLGW